MIVERLARAGAAHRVTDQEALLRPPPTLHVAVLTCMDCRIDIARILDLQLGEVHMLRNAGGVVTDDVIRSLVISQQKLGTTEIMVMQHTNCGMMATTEAELAADVEDATGQVPLFSFGTFDDLEASVRRGVRTLRSHPLLVASTVVRGFVYSVETGEVSEVEVPSVARAQA